MDGYTLPQEGPEAEEKQAVSPKDASRKKSLILFSAIFLVSLCILGVFYLSGKKPHKLPLQKHQFATPPPTRVSQQPTTTAPHWELRKQTSAGQQVITSFSEDYNPLVVYGNNTIFYKDSNQHIEGYDTQSGETKQTFPQSFYNSLKPGYNTTSMQIIGDTLFFSAGAWPVGGEEYWESLTTPTTPQFITKLTGFDGYVVSKNNHAFLIDFWSGDVCGSGATYYLFDPSTKGVGDKIAQISYGCVNGYNDKGIDKEDRLLLPYAEDTGPTAILPGAGPNNLLVYTRIDAYSFTTSQIIPLLSPEQMPPNITSTVYDATNDRLLLLGKSLYSFKLQSRSLKREMDLPASWSTQAYFSGSTPGSVCIMEVDKKSQNYKYFTINLASQAIGSVGKCPIDKSTAVFDNLGFLPPALPQGYSLMNIIKN